MALKLLRAADSGPSAIRRFEAEAEILARLRDPAIAQVYEAGVEMLEGEATPYLAMELIRGARSIGQQGQFAKVGAGSERTVGFSADNDVYLTFEDQPQRLSTGRALFDDPLSGFEVSLPAHFRDHFELLFVETCKQRGRSQDIHCFVRNHVPPNL